MQTMHVLYEYQITWYKVIKKIQNKEDKYNDKEGYVKEKI